MALRVISGPPGSGREGSCSTTSRPRSIAIRCSSPPPRDDVDRLERELCRRGSGALLGGGVISLPGLFEEVGRATGTSGGARMTRMQRVWLARVAAARAPLRQLRRSAARDGFAPALETLLSDLQAAGLDAASLTAAVEQLDDGGYERELAELFRIYEELRDGLALGDEYVAAERAIAALRADPSRWRGRPVLLYGFDDLTRQQVELVGALAGAADVTVAITFEQERPALEARAQLRGVLVDELGGAADEPLPRRPANPGADPPSPRATPVRARCAAAGSRRLAAAAGGRRGPRRGRADRPPDRPPARRRHRPRRHRRRRAQPRPPGAAARARALRPRHPGRGGGADPALRHGHRIGGARPALDRGRGGDRRRGGRLPARPRPGAPSSIDWLERRILRGRLETAAEAIESWRGGERDRRIWELDAIAEAGSDPLALAAALSRIAADVAQRPHLRSGIVPSAGPAVELRAAAEIAAALAELTELGDHAPAADELTEVLGHVRVPLWRGGTEGRVRILSPYRLRATQLRHLFVAGLADGSFPGRRPADPLLADDRRGELGLTARSDPVAEERFLFYSCVSRPEQPCTSATRRATSRERRCRGAPSSTRSGP